MISVCIWGMPRFPEETLIALTKHIHAVLQPVATNDPTIEGSNKTKICVFFQADLMAWELGAEILIEVKGCHFDIAVENQYVFQALTDRIKELVDNCEYVECRIQPRTPDHMICSR